ncbi:MAG: peptidoglycan DD-metalloendopeptidase family protein [Acidobacteriota bacterium]|nr:peptidoglycan DD-metalloendopeptidase family protein [Acidobacteriota bacterium]
MRRLAAVLVLVLIGPPEGGRYMHDDETTMWRPALAGLFAQSPADEVRARAAARIRSLQAEADRLAAQSRTVFGDLRRLELEREIAREEVARAEADLTRVSATHAQAAARLKGLEATRLAQTPGVSERLIEISKRGRGGYLQLLLASDDPRAFGRLSRGVAAVAELDRVRLETHRRTVVAERASLATVEKQRAAVEQSRTAAQRTRATLDAAVAARNRLIDSLDQQRDLAAQFVGELQAAQRQIERTLATADATAATAALPIRPFRGDLPWPVTGPVVSRFGRSTSGRFGTAIVRNGIDVAAPEGTVATAVHEGRVAYAAPFAGFGVLVIVDHGGSAFTLYGHLSEATVTEGTVLKAGEMVGRVGLAPAGAAALYFEVRIDGRPVDPLQWLRRSTR